MFNRVLIANRGEIACRIIKTAKRLGCTTIAIYSVVDENALHTRLADEAYALNATQAADTYLNIDKIITLARLHKIDAIHPGYGFLAENADFARACAENQICFIGPHPDVIATMGSKAEAKKQLAATQVPLLPGYHGTDQSLPRLCQEAKKIGYPVLLKPALGGGGKGMYCVANEQALMAAAPSAKRAAQKAFGNDQLILEKFLAHARHIECQVFADHFGNVVHLYDRDCSVQRRHQKIIEEAPASALAPTQRQQLYDAAITIAKSIQYLNAGTIEFMCTEDKFYFLEMNTRLQVEHPVTERITGIDCVEWQLRIANHEPLPCQQDELQANGHAIEVRLYAEDPDQQFLPSTGTINHLTFPCTLPGLRIDAGVSQGDTITTFYDPMLAKIICHHTSRSLAIKQLQAALAQCQIDGVKTNIDFCRKLLMLAEFSNGHYTTNLVADHETDCLSQSQQLPQAVAMAACHQFLNQTQAVQHPKHDPHSPWDKLDAWQAAQPAQIHYHFYRGSQRLTAKIRLTSPITIHVDAVRFSFAEKTSLNHLCLCQDTETWQAHVVQTLRTLTIFGLDEIYHFSTSPATMEPLQAGSGHVTSPMPANVVEILVAPGDSVAAGAKLILLEAMKMEHTVSAPVAGIIEAIYVTKDAAIQEGSQLLSIRTP